MTLVQTSECIVACQLVFRKTISHLRSGLHNNNERKSLLRRSHAVLPSHIQSYNQLDSAHHPTMGGPSAKYGGVINQLWGGPSAKYGGVINQLWGGHQSSMGGPISQVWGGASAKYGGGHQPNMGGPSAKYGGGAFSHQYVQEVKIQRITLATHTSCHL